MATGSKKLTQARPVASKRASGAKPAGKTGRDTLEKLRAHVDDIEKRLKRANTLTRTSVRALQSSYEALSGDNQASKLTEHIEALSDRLTGMVEKTRLDVTHDLKIVLNDPRLETLSGALTKANQRLTQAEQNQAEAINAINLHIARLATAVDDRLRTEEQKRQKADESLARRVEKVEHDSAEAIKTIGDKVVAVSEDFTSRLQSHKGEMAEEALERQQDYEEHKHVMAQRIEAVEDEYRNQIPAIERDIAMLTSRMETLEQGGRFETETPAPVSAIACQAPPVIKAGDAYETITPKPVGAVDQPENAFAAPELADGLEMSPPQNITKPETYEPQYPTPVFAPEDNRTDDAPDDQVIVPVHLARDDVGDATGEANVETAQFYPREYVPHGPEYVAQPPSEPESYPEPYSVSNTGILEYNPSSGMTGMATMPRQDALAPVLPQAQEAVMTAPPIPPFAPDPVPMPEPPPMPGETAGHEFQAPKPGTAQEPVPPQLALQQEPTMENARPGVDPQGKARTGKKKLGNDGSGGGHGLVRKIALFGGVAVVALFAYKTIAPKIFGTDAHPPLSTQAEQTKQLAHMAMPGQTGSKETKSVPAGENTGSEDASSHVLETVEPIGDYSRAMSAPDLGSNKAVAHANKQTLEAAAAGGNAIAQFQLGLSHLEAGRDAEALRLIRLAANQGQPAAQYRLAKLYEAGIGVQVNGKTAKGLLKRAAKAGNRMAMHDLGHYYATGADGSSPDIGEAVKWFSQAADRGVLDSQFNLGVLYQGGSGVPRSLEDAYHWYTIAGLQGDKIAKQRSEAIASELSSDKLEAARTHVEAYAPKPVNNAANGVFTNLPWISTVAGGNTKVTIQSVQKMLAALGYNVGKPDGAMGPNTRNAIISFERANGMPETGRVNAALIERLELAAGA